MARDKQLIVRLEESDRDKFKQFCQNNGLEMSSFLYEIICRFNDGSLSLDHIVQPTASTIDSEGIADIKKSLMAELSGLFTQAIAEMEAKTTAKIESLEAELEQLKKPELAA